MIYRPRLDACIVEDRKRIGNSARSCRASLRPRPVESFERLLEFIGTDVARAVGTVSGVRTRTAALIGRHRIATSVDARPMRDRINRRAERLERDGLRRTAVARESIVGELRIGIVPAPGRAEEAARVIGDVVTAVDVRTRTITRRAAAGEDAIGELYRRR